VGVAVAVEVDEELEEDEEEVSELLMPMASRVLMMAAETSDAPCVLSFAWRVYRRWNFAVTFA